jgi:hypothetical protein
MPGSILNRDELISLAATVVEIPSSASTVYGNKVERVGPFEHQLLPRSNVVTTAIQDSADVRVARR